MFRTVPPEGQRKARSRHAVGATLVASRALSLGACRKPAPDEVVYTGRMATPKPPVGTGGTGGSGGATGGGARPGTGGTGGSSGAGGAGGTVDPTTPFSKS